MFLGDIVGRAGRESVKKYLPYLRQRFSLDLVVVNAENASHGFGLSPSIAESLLVNGVDVITLGNHSWDRKDIISYMEQEIRVIRPLNYPEGTPGRGFIAIELNNGQRVLVANIMGRIYMDPLDDPFRVTEELLLHYKLGQDVQAAIMDFHGEATSEKTAFAHAFDGRFSLIIGTHTHVPTADTRILPKGTAYQTDAGMCGDYDSVIGMNKDAVIAKFRTCLPIKRMEPATGIASICGVMVDVSLETGLAHSVQPIRIGGDLMQTHVLPQST